MQSGCPREVTAISCAAAAFQQTGDAAGWAESTRALGKVPFCFSVRRTHLYFIDPVVFVRGSVLVVNARLPAGGAPMAAQGVPRGTKATPEPTNDSWQNSSSKYWLPKV